MNRYWFCKLQLRIVKLNPERKNIYTHGLESDLNINYSSQHCLKEIKITFEKYCIATRTLLSTIVNTLSILVSKS